MTRFARAKGSKASNEKLPEQATSWSEMKQEMLNKNKEIAEEKGRQEALKKRQANYQAFLQEKEEKEDKNTAWADFPEANKKRKVSENIISPSNKKVKNFNEDSDDEHFSALKLQIDKALEKQNDNAEEESSQQIVDSDDSDAAPEEISMKQKPQEIVVKKAKNTKQKLKIALEPAKKSETILTEKEQKLVVKKQERYKRQLEKKKLRKQQKQNENPAPEAPKKVETKEEMEAAKQARKLARRERQKEKRRLGRLQKAEENKPKLGEEDLKKINKKKEKKVKQLEKRQKFKETLKSEEIPNGTEANNNSEKNFNGGKNFNSNNNSNESNNFIPNRKLNESKNFNSNNNPNQSRNFNEDNNFTPNKNFNSNNNRNQSRNLNDDNNFTPNKNFNESKNFNSYNNPNESKNFNKFNEQEPKPQIKKPPKPRDNNKNHQSRKQKPEIMYINGKTVDVDYVDGFPVKKEDADRLKQLRKEMISKGLPRSEINVALKLERRRAEKAFTREKKNVCFNCRKSGHNLSECPELGKDQGLAQTAGTGICFKCGSTEHTHFQCKVVKGMDYKFATCFICKEPGHISRQCPDNQRGLYPKGGSCKVCGDVTHLKKDCPKYQAQQSQLQSSLSIGLMDNGNPDDFEGTNGANNNAGFVRRPNKVVKF